MANDLTPQVQNVLNVDQAHLQQVSFTASSAASSNVIAANAALFYATQDCYLVFAASPTATTSGFFLPKGIPLALTVPGGSKVAAIRDSADGKLFVAPLN